MDGAELAQAVTTLRRRGRDRHRTSSTTSRELDRHDPDAACRAAHQHRLAGSEVGMAKAEVGHYSRTPERHRVDGRDGRREGDERRDRGDHALGVAARAGERPHPPADPHRVDAIADSGHGARDLATEDVTFREAVGGEGAASDHGVHTADADRLGGDQHLPVRGTRLNDIDDCQALGTSERLDRDCLH